MSCLRDWLPSLKMAWSAEMNCPKVVGFGKLSGFTASKSFLLHLAFIALDFWQISQLGSLGKCVKMLCVQIGATLPHFDRCVLLRFLAAPPASTESRGLGGSGMSLFLTEESAGGTDSFAPDCSVRRPLFLVCLGGSAAGKRLSVGDAAVDACGCCCCCWSCCFCCCSSCCLGC